MLTSDLRPARRGGLVGSLAATRELAAQRAVLDAHERTGGAESFAAELEELFVEARDGGARARAGAVAVASWVALRVSADPHALELLAAAAERAALPLARVLLAGGAASAALATGGRLPEVAIAARSSLAAPHHDRPTARMIYYGTGWGFARRERLRAHHDPVMIGRLLDETWVGLRDVLIIASRRPSVPAIAWAIATRDRWISRSRVREALAANPFTPAALALALLPCVSTATVLDLARGRPSDVQRAARLFG